MSEAETSPFVAEAVDALIAAYDNAADLIENIKEKRKVRRAPPLDDALEEAVQDGHFEIQNIQARGVRKYGASFEQGDGMFRMSTSLLPY
jgi:hypothetical protein